MVKTHWTRKVFERKKSSDLCIPTKPFPRPRSSSDVAFQSFYVKDIANVTDVNSPPQILTSPWKLILNGAANTLSLLFSWSTGLLLCIHKLVVKVLYSYVKHWICFFFDLTGKHTQFVQLGITKSFSLMTTTTEPLEGGRSKKKN